MAEMVQETQAVVLAVVLVTACLAKLLIREPRHPAPRTPATAAVHGMPVPPEVRWSAFGRHNRAFVAGLGVVEGGLGIALLLTPHLWVRVTTTLAFAAATWVVGELRTRRSDAGCGCFGGLSNKQVGRRSVVRAALLTAAAIASLGGREAGLHVLWADPGRVCLLVALELALFAALSPELGPLLKGGRRLATPCERRRSPMTETYATLHGSGPWRDHRRLLTAAEPLDVWREGCWRFLVFAARLDDQNVEVVFAVSTQERHRTVRVAVEEAEWEPQPDDGLDDAGRHEVVETSDDTGPNPRYAVL